MYKQIDSNKQRTVILMVLFVLIILVLGWIFGEITGYGYWGLVIAIIISLLMTMTSYFKGDKVALWSAGAKPIIKEDNPYVFRMVENLCITAGVPMPKIYFINDPAPNAFATGRDPEHASIALTSGIIEKLENEELEGVIAHELSHIKNFDIRLMMVVAVLVGMIVLISNWMFRIRIGGNRGKGGQLGAIILIIGVVLAILSPLIAEFIKMAISRKREYLADASGALLTRYPAGLASALEKISSYSEPMRRANNGTAHLFIANPFGAKAKRGLAHMFSTHPPIEERVSKLKDMA